MDRQETYAGKQHLPRYLSRFDFRYNARKLKVGGRSLLPIKGINGKRFMPSDSRAYAAKNN
jgi:hypothetical protein